MKVKINGWNVSRLVGISKSGVVRLNVAFHDTVFCRIRVEDLRKRLEEKMLQGELRREGDETWFIVKMSKNQLKDPLKYLSRIVGARITRITGT